MPRPYQSSPSCGSPERLYLFLWLPALTKPSTVPDGDADGVQIAGTASGSAPACGASSGAASAVVSSGSAESSARTTTGRNPEGSAFFDLHSLGPEGLGEPDGEGEGDPDGDGEGEPEGEGEGEADSSKEAISISAVRTAGAWPEQGTQGETKPTTVAAPASAMTARVAWPRDSPPWEERGSRIVRSRSSKLCGRVPPMPSARAGVGWAGEPSERKMPRRCPAYTEGFVPEAMTRSSQAVSASRRTRRVSHQASGWNQ